MQEVKCEKCRKEADYGERFEIILGDGFTHTFCKKCGEEMANKIAEKKAEKK
ncbi:MAG: hypothetical protein ABIH83_04530 [Candidatus Micrarchaeota archaeon]